jgi:hypothetical protein
MELFKASGQWATRPADERFSTIAELDAACNGYRAVARTATALYHDMKAYADSDGSIRLNGKTASASLTHWAFGQLASRAGAPASYMRELPAKLAADCINHGLALRDAGEEAHLMFHSNGALVCRSITSERYDRIWNSDVTKRLLALTGEGWRLPPARPSTPGQPGSRFATADDVLPAGMGGGGGLSVNVGDLIAPAGAYASDHDMFVFLIDPTHPITDPMGQVLWRGFFTWNSEVGAASFGIETFLFRSVCGNHIVWSAQDVRQVRIRHVGDANERSRAMLAEVYKYRDGAASDDESKLRLAAAKVLGATKEEVLDSLFRMRLPVSHKTLDASYTAAEEHSDTDGNPRSVFGMVQGMTRVAQLTYYTDERVAIDRAAAKVMEVAF